MGRSRKVRCTGKAILRGTVCMWHLGKANPGTQSAWVGDRVPLARVNSETTLFLFLFVLTRTLHYAHHTTHYARASRERRPS